AEITFPKEKVDEDAANVEKLLSGELNGYVMEKQYQHKEGHMIDITLSVQGVRKNDGTIDYILILIDDITERKKAEKMLYESQEHLTSAFEHATIGMALVSPKGNYTRVNSSLCNIIGYSEDELLTKSFREITHPDDLEKDNTFINQMLAGEISNYQTEKRYFHKLGQVVWVMLSVSLVHDAQGKPLYFVAQIQNITERKQSEEKIRNINLELEQRVEERTQQLEAINENLQKEIEERKLTEAQLIIQSTALNAASNAIVITNISGKIEWINPAFTKLTSYTFEEITGKNPRILKSGKHDVAFYNNLWNTILSGEIWHGEIINKRKDGSEYNEDMTITPLKDENGEITRFIAIKQDITERKRAEDRIRLIVESASNAIILVDANGFIQLVNTQTENYFGYQRAELMGQKIEMLVPNATKMGHVKLRTNFTHQPSVHKMGVGRDLYGLRKDGTKIPIEVGLSPIYINNEHLILTSIIDITERKIVEEAIKNAKTEAERANVAKSEFLSRMSHELRTPLNSILGFTQLMSMGELNPAHKKGVDHIMKSGKHLLNLINEVLDLSRIEAGELSISIEPVELKGIIMETLDIIQPMATERAVKIELENTDMLNLYVKADHQKLKQVMLNLINNAVKFNNKGGLITISISQSQNEKIKVSIIDTGKGIASEDISKLFNPFQRIGTEISVIEGTGLGLAVSKKLMEAMHGSIGVESEVGVGSTFWIELPQTESQNGHHERIGDFMANETLSKNISGILLYIEDNISNQQLVKQIMDTQRPAVNLIANMYGKNALDIAIDYKPDLILLDLNLPDIHGNKVLELLQKNNKTKDIPVIVLSADATEKQIEKLLKAGASAYLTKPIDVLELLREVDKRMNN
ncbi:MAG: PAS domain S-box protein, partial [Flavobacteriaceae bacterium]|nr:PAS domain S-box protein [Flavobacteriaceae bacterium]